MVVTSYFILSIGGYEIDAATAALIAALVALFATLAVTVLDAMVLEKNRQQAKREAETEALREKIYVEIAWNLRGLSGDISTDFVLRHMETYKQLFNFLKELAWSPIYQDARNAPGLYYQIKDARAISAYHQRMNGLVRRFAGSPPDNETKEEKKKREDEEFDDVQDFVINRFEPALVEAICWLELPKLLRIYESQFAEKGSSREPPECIKELARQFIHEIFNPVGDISGPGR